MRFIFSSVSLAAAFQQHRDGVKSLLRLALLQDGPDVQETTNDACMVAAHYADEGSTFYIRTSDLLEKLEFCNDPGCAESFTGDYTALKLPEARAKIVNDIVSEAFPEFSGELLTPCENTVPAGYSHMSQPCPSEEGGPIVEMSGLDTITKCKDGFMNKAKNTIAWFADGHCFIGNDQADRAWLDESCHMDAEVEGLKALPEWSLMRDEVFTPIE